MQFEVWLAVLTFFFWPELKSVMAALERTCTPFTKSFGPHPRGLCGNRIDETLSLLCIGGYNERPSYYRRKRDVDTNENFLKQSGILIPRDHANSYLVKRSNFYEQGIVCECCYNRCHLMELFAYCRNGPGIYGLFKRSTDRQRKIHLNQFPSD